MKAFHEIPENVFLSLCSGILRPTSLIEPSDIADAYRVGIVTGAVGSYHFEWTALFDGPVESDDEVVANHLEYSLLVPSVDILYGEPGGCGNDASAFRAAIVYSLISTCKAAGVEPREWMEDVLRKLPYYHRDGKDISELLP